MFRASDIIILHAVIASAIYSKLNISQVIIDFHGKKLLSISVIDFVLQGITHSRTQCSIDNSFTRIK